LKTDGSLWATGQNSLGQLGDGTTSDRSTPVQVATGVQAVAAGYNCSLFLKTGGTLWAVGYNAEGQLGDGTTANRSTPVQVATGVQAIVVGSFHSLFLKTDGTLWAMGQNSSGQLGDGTKINRSTPVQVATSVQAVAAGYYHNLFLKTDRTLWAVGSNSYGQLGDGTTTDRYTPVQVATGVQAVAAGNNSSLYVTLTGTPGAVVPSITAPPASQYVAPGSSATFTVAAGSTSSLGYQWKLNGTAIAGATNAAYTVANVQPGNMGFYSVTVSNSAGSVDSAVAILTVSGGSSRLTGLSTRGYVPTGGALTPGFYLRGSGAKAIIVRGVGPTLGGFGIAGPLSDPRMDLIPVGGTTLLTNDDWGTNTNLPALRAAMPFPLVEGSRDAAALATLATATNYGYTVRIVPNGTATDGIAMAEVYDLDATTAPVQLISLSTLGYTGPGEKILTPGFIITGDGPKQLLVRAVGPTLGAAPYNVPGVLADPQFRVVPLNKDFEVANNDNWGGTVALQAAFTQTHDFDLPTGSRDAAAVVRLPPGGYTVQATGVGGTAGNVLVEIYDMDP
jgi:hypothetical protein